MSTGTYHSYTLEQCIGGWIVQTSYDRKYLFVSLEDATTFLRNTALENFCCEYDAAGNPLRAA